MKDKISFTLLRNISGGSFIEMLVMVSRNQWLLLAAALSVSFAIILLAAKIWIGRVWRNGPNLPKRALTIFMAGMVIFGLTAVAAAYQSSPALAESLRRFPAVYVLQKVLHLLTDLDRDGSSAFSYPPDPDGLDADRYPFAADLPGNGIDENGLLGDLPPSKGTGTISGNDPPRFLRRPHFVLVVLESFRVDLLFNKKSEVEVTPNLNRLAIEGVHTKWGFSHNGYTIGGMNAIFLGNFLHSPAKGTLVDDFKANGYETACFSAEDESFGDIAKTTGLYRMDHFYDARQDVGRRTNPFTSPGSLTVPAEVVLERLTVFLSNRTTPNRPLFLYINFQDLHFPYHHYAVKPTLHPKPLRRSQINTKNSPELINTYLNTAAYVDANVGVLIARLKKYLGDEIALVVLADHGESLFDDSFLGHGHHLTDIQMRIPIIVNGFPALLEEPMGQS